ALRRFPPRRPARGRGGDPPADRAGPPAAGAAHVRAGRCRRLAVALPGERWLMAELPDYYFRVRENGAFVFRVDTENRMRRIEMDQIAAVNIRNGEIKPHGDRPLSEADLAAIRAW